MVLDNNVLISALVFRSSNPRRVMELALVGEVRLVSSPPILNELEEVLARKFQRPALVAHAIVSELEAIALVADPAEVPRGARDPDDDTLLATAVGGQASWIVSGDKDLLAIGSYCGVEITTAAWFLRLLGH